jgi:hypothetical protein
MSSNWNGLRTWNGSQERAFEELCCQLAAGEQYRTGSRFVRKGAPDAGVECLWRLPSGDEHGWQAKFFQSPPSPSQWSQIDASVKTVLEKHPKLTRYTMCLPVDRSDARLPRQKSFLDKWSERVEKWNSWAHRRTMAVDFIYWGDSEFANRLSREENRGRYWFWFNRDELTLAWFRKKLEVAIDNAGDRYTPRIHVDLPLSQYFDALGRTPAFHERLNDLYRRLLEAARGFRTPYVTEGAKQAAARASDAVGRLSELLDGVLIPLEEDPRQGWVKRIPSEKIARLAETLAEGMDQTWTSLNRACHESDVQEPASEDLKVAKRRLEDDATHCLRLATAANQIASFCDQTEARVADRPALLLTGEAGQGKTHLLCDVGERDIKAGRPRILLHGCQFGDAEPWSQIIRILGLSCSADEFRGALEAAAQAFGCRILILIDALNESERRSSWEKFLSGMLTEISWSPWLGIALSVRSSYESVVIPDGLVPERLARVVHSGFQEHENEAVHRFFEHFGILPTIPLLVPEFTKPLFLRDANLMNS